jgi:hypothetical protein
VLGRIRRTTVLLSCCLAWAALAGAAPDLAARRAIGSMIVFPDDHRADLYYYAPLEMRLATGPDGRPELSFLEMRYTGSGMSRDRGLVLHRSLLTARVELPARSADELARCARTLGGAGRAPDLQPLPLRRIEAALVYTAIAPEDSATGVLAGGRIQGSRESEGPPDQGYWNERVFTVGVDSLTSQVFHSTLAKGQLSLSLGFAFVADGRLAAEPWGAIDGPASVSDALRAAFAAAADSGAARDSVLRRVVVAGAIPIRVDVRRWPDLLRRVDVGDASGYAALDLYCYDFRDNRRPDLYERQVEVEGESVGGRAVRLQAVFARAHPDVYSVSLRFPVAVKLDRPYRYRVTDVRSDGSSTQGSWSTGRDWVDLLDLTTPTLPTARGVRPIR